MNKQAYTEEYFKKYKHVIGCDFEYRGKVGVFIRRAKLIDCTLKPFFIDNLNYMYQLEFIKFYIDDETLGTYEEYMNTHYPEYKHWWEIK